MLNNLMRFIKKYIPVGRLSYAQEGEDLILARLLGSVKTKKGFFIDIGAHHPFRFSNTYYFYKRGWSGINIDPFPGTVKLFNRLRSRDITIECGVSDKEGNLIYYLFDEPALNTFSKREAKIKQNYKYKLINQIEIPVLPLKKILNNNLPKDTKIDFMSIDVEGLEYEVISSNDWIRYRPTLIAVELLNTTVSNVNLNPAAKILFEQNYLLLAKTYNTFFFSLPNDSQRLLEKCDI